MPKFVYSAAKGIEQQSGSGFIVQDVPISRSVANSGSDITSANATFTYTEEVYIIDIAGAHTMVIPNGSTVGEEKVIVTKNGDGGTALTVGGVSLGSPAAGACFLLVWTGSAWAQLQ